MDDKNKLKSSRNVSIIKVDDDMKKLMMKIGILLFQTLFRVLLLLSKDSWPKFVQKHQRTNRKYRIDLRKIFIDFFQEKNHQEEFMLLLKEKGLSEFVIISDEVDEVVKSFKNILKEIYMALFSIPEARSALLSDLMIDLSNDGFKDQGRLSSLVAKVKNNDLPVEEGPSFTKIYTNITLIEISYTDNIRESFNALLSTGDIYVGHKLTTDNFDTKHMLQFVQKTNAKAVLISNGTDQIIMSEHQPYLSHIINMGIFSQEDKITYRLSTYPLYIERNKSQIYCGYIHDITPMLSHELKQLYLEEEIIPLLLDNSVLSKYINEIKSANENPICEDRTNDSQRVFDKENKAEYDKYSSFKFQNVNQQRKKKNKNRDRNKNIISFPKRFSSGLTYEQEIRNNLQIALEQVKANGFLHQQQGLHIPPYVVWPSGHALLQHKIRFIAMSLYSNEYIKRLHTFLLGRNRNGNVWPDNCVVRPEPLVNAGFSYCGVQSKVVCDQCGFESTTDDWTDDDDDYAISIHRQTQTECPFLTRKPETSPATYERLSNNDCVALETTIITHTTHRNDERYRNNNNIVTYLFVSTIHSDIPVITTSSYRQPAKTSVSETRTKINHVNKINSETSNLIINTNLADPFSHSKHITTNNKVNNTSRSAYELSSNQSSYGRIPHSLKTPFIMVSQENTFIPDVNAEDLLIYFRPDMESVETRIQTYIYLEKSYNDVHIYLAKNGFFFAGYIYGVRCFSCGLSVANFCQTEYKGLTIIHSLIRPDCIYLQTSMDLNKMKHLRYQFFQADGEKYPKYKYTSERIKSLTERYTFDKIVSEKFAEAGFFLKAPYDNTIYCFQCGGGFHYTDVLQSIWRSHAKWFPFCKFVRCKMGNEYIKNVLNTTMNQPANVHRGAVMFLQDMVLSPKEGSLCVFCKHFPINTINLACGHKRSCKDCSIRICYCDYCDTFIERIVDI